MVFHYLDRFFAALAAASREGVPARELFYAAFDREDVGRGGDFERLYPELREKAGLRWSRDQFRMAWNDIFEPNPPMVEFVRRLPHPRVLLSNTHEPHVTWIKTRFPDVFPLFDHHVLSHEVGKAKPDPEIFRWVESLTRAAPAEHVFVDDLEHNVAAARAVGWQGVLFIGVEDCRARLAALGVTAGG